MSKIYNTSKIAQVQATKAAKKEGVPMNVIPVQGGWSFEPVVVQVEEVKAPRIVDTVQVELPPVIAPSMLPVARSTEVKAISTVTMSFPLSKLQPAYVEAWHEGKLTWFAKDSLMAWAVDGDEGVHPLVTVTMLRSKAVRRRLVQPAA